MKAKPKEQAAQPQPKLNPEFTEDFLQKRRPGMFIFLHPSAVVYFNQRLGAAYWSNHAFFMFFAQKM